MVGLDYQANLLDAATQLAAARGVSLPLVRGDMRCLPFGAQFAAVQCMFTAFGYLSDDENAHILHEVERVLRPGGWFMLDVANRDALLRQAQERSWKRLPDGTVVISEWSWDVPTGRYTHWQLLVNEDMSRSYSHAVRVYTYTELAAMLRRAGLTVETVYGGVDGGPLTLAAPRMIILARKSEML
jgi:SAM-dependent methyltransferase